MLMNTMPDLSQLTHEQLLKFTRQLAMQHQQLEKSNQQLDAKVQHLEVTNQHLSILNQKYEHQLALFKNTNSAVKMNISPPNKSICGMKRLKKISQQSSWNWNG